MQKIELLALLSDSKKIIDFLQRKGTVEIAKTDVPEAMYSMDTSSTVSQLEKFLAVAREAAEILDLYVPRDKKLTDSFKPRRELELSKFLDMADDADLTMAKCFELISRKKEIAEKRADIIRYSTLCDGLSVWTALDIPLNTASTARTSVLIGTFPEEYTEDALREKLAAALPEIETVEVRRIFSGRVQTGAVVLCMRENTQAVSDALRTFGFVGFSERTPKTAAEVVSGYKEKIRRLEEEIGTAEEKIRALAPERENIEFVADYFMLRADKYEAFKEMAVSNNVFYFSGYIPQKYCAATVRQIEEKFTAAITISEIPGDDENEPVLLENNAFSAPVEGITEMYALPGKRDIDPNAIMSFFYYCFFGMMFSDAGYGLLMVIATLVVLLKCKPEGEKKKTVLMYMYCGISTVFWGLMFGSFFGDIINVIRTDFLGLEAVRLYLWKDPQNDLMSVMLWCFLFGVVHLFVGVAIKGCMEWRQGHRFGAVADTLSIYLAVGGALPMCAGMIIEVPGTVQTVGKYCALIGVALIVLTAGRSSKGVFGKLGSGLYALYNTISGYLSDILSYSRLLALGLVTGIIGSVVNMMGVLPSNPVVKALLLLVVFAVGHTVNFGINVIGAYVHTNRLQYVEFFSRFYGGGGKAFKPLGVNTKTFKFKEEIYNG